MLAEDAAHGIGDLPHRSVSFHRREDCGHQILARSGAGFHFGD